MSNQEIHQNPKQALTRSRLKRISVTGYKTLNPLRDFEPRLRTVLIGPNGAGKSNFISFFRMVSNAMSGTDQLACYVGQKGGSGQILHDGPDHTREIKATFTIQTSSGMSDYDFHLLHAARDTLIFANERYRFTRSEWRTEPDWYTLGAGHKDPGLLKVANDHQTARIIHTLLRRIVVYQFHNTSDYSRIRGKWSIGDNRWLKEDAANIAPVLFRLKTQETPHYRNIVDYIRLALPMFSDFELEPEHGYLILKWREKDTDEVFDASQASDGFLRMVALITLLLQPPDDLPDTLIIDEPELGLHPLATDIVGNLIASAALNIQIIVATQSVLMVNCFEPEDIVIVERPGRASTFRRLDAEDLREWLSDYSLAELWEKNVLGGRP